MAVCDLEEQVNTFTYLRRNLEQDKDFWKEEIDTFITYNHELSMILGFHDPINNNSVFHN